jgi:trans-2,3-dihydro-3-hydroxyanthranilate isomerase
MEFKLIDAFATEPLSGNPCAVVIGAEDLSDRQMLGIAKEMNQSETAFLMRSRDCHLKARYFTPEREIPLAGHPTIASVHAAIECGMIRPTGNSFSISLELNDGPIRVDVVREPSGFLIRMFQRTPQFLSVHDGNKIAAIFNLTTSDFMNNTRIQTVSTGTPMLMVPLSSKAALAKVKMDVDQYRAYRKQSDFFSPHFFILEGESKDADTFARHLGTPPDTLEDAFTGSATGCMAAYLWKYGLIKKSKLVAEQGHWMGRPGRAYVEGVGNLLDLESVIVAGSAVTVVDGKIRVK